MKNYIVSVYPGSPDVQTTVGILYVEYVPIQLLKLPNVALRERNELIAVTHLRQIEQFPLDATFEKIVENIAKKMDNAELYMDCDLLVHENDSGAPLADFMRLSGLFPTYIHSTSGSLPATRKMGWSVPKRDLVNSLSILMETQRFLISQDEEDQEYTDTIDKLKKQLEYYTEDSERIELLMCAAMGTWWIAKQGAVQQPKQPANKTKKYNPLSYGI